MASAAAPAVRAETVPFLVKAEMPLSFCYDGFGHDAPCDGALWQVPARRVMATGRGAQTRAECQRLYGRRDRNRQHRQTEIRRPRYDRRGHFLRSWGRMGAMLLV